MGSIISLLLGGLASWLPSIGKSFVDGYKAKLDANNNSERIAADQAARELALEARERELQAQMVAADEGRWWTALPRPLFAAPFILFAWKVIVWDKVLAWGSTDALSPEMMTWGGLILTAYFGGRSLEKVARIATSALRK